MIGIEIFRDRSHGWLCLSQEAYISKVLERFHMNDYGSVLVPIKKGDKFSLSPCPKNELKQKQMKDYPYASIVGGLMYAQVCTRPGISYVVGILGRYQSNPRLYHWKATKKVLRYICKGLRIICLHLKGLIILRWLVF